MKPKETKPFGSSLDSSGLVLVGPAEAGAAAVTVAPSALGSSGAIKVVASSAVASSVVASSVALVVAGVSAALRSTVQPKLSHAVVLVTYSLEGLGLVVLQCRPAVTR
jgi:hypothetical protein